MNIFSYTLIYSCHSLHKTNNFHHRFICFSNQERVPTNGYQENDRHYNWLDIGVQCNGHEIYNDVLSWYQFDLCLNKLFSKNCGFHLLLPVLLLSNPLGPSLTKRSRLWLISVSVFDSPSQSTLILALTVRGTTVCMYDLFFCKAGKMTIKYNIVLV